MRKNIILLVLMFSQTLFASDWNQLSCFMGKRTGGKVESSNTQYYNENFSLEIGESKSLVILWSKKSTDGQVGSCSKIMGAGQDNSALITVTSYKGSTINMIDSNCVATGENIVETTVVKKMINRGEFIETPVPWTKPGFDSLFIVEYIPTAAEINGNLYTFALKKCSEFADRYNKNK